MPTAPMLPPCLMAQPWQGFDVLLLIARAEQNTQQMILLNANNSYMTIIMPD